MVEYFVRVNYLELTDFYGFCDRHNIEYKSISTDLGYSMLHTAEMTHEDAMALKLFMQVNIMEIENG
jgi:hypothetical protein